MATVAQIGELGEKRACALVWSCQDKRARCFIVAAGTLGAIASAGEEVGVSFRGKATALGLHVAGRAA